MNSSVAVSRASILLFALSFLSSCGNPVPTKDGTQATKTELSTAAVAGDSKKPATAAVSNVKLSASGEAKCLITGESGEELDGPCLFEAGSGGSFDLLPLEGDYLMPEISSVSLTVTSKGKGYVRGLTSAGINSMWGDVERSKTDPACWDGSDFTICVY